MTNIQTNILTTLGYEVSPPPVRFRFHVPTPEEKAKKKEEKREARRASIATWNCKAEQTRISINKIFESDSAAESSLDHITELEEEEIDAPLKEEEMTNVDRMKNLLTQQLSQSNFRDDGFNYFTGAKPKPKDETETPKPLPPIPAMEEPLPGPSYETVCDPAPYVCDPAPYVYTGSEAVFEVEYEDEVESVSSSSDDRFVLFKGGDDTEDEAEEEWGQEWNDTWE